MVIGQWDCWDSCPQILEPRARQGMDSLGVAVELISSSSVPPPRNQYWICLLCGNFWSYATPDLAQEPGCQYHAK